MAFAGKWTLQAYINGHRPIFSVAKRSSMISKPDLQAIIDALQDWSDLTSKDVEAMPGLKVLL